MSSSELAERAQVTAAQLRRDLLVLGASGIRGIGYDVETLRAHLNTALGAHRVTNAVIVGIAPLGLALARYGGVARSGYRIVGLFDNDPLEVGQQVDGLPIEDASQLEKTVAERAARIAILTVPASVAQDIAERLAGAGVRAILNFASTALQAPDEVRVHRVDVTNELQVLKYYEHWW